MLECNVPELGEMLRSRAERRMPLASSLGVYTVTGEKAGDPGQVGSLMWWESLEDALLSLFYPLTEMGIQVTSPLPRRW